MGLYLLQNHHHMGLAPVKDEVRSKLSVKRFTTPNKKKAMITDISNFNYYVFCKGELIKWDISIILFITCSFIDFKCCRSLNYLLQFASMFLSFYSYLNYTFFTAFFSIYFGLSYILSHTIV